MRGESPPPAADATLPLTAEGLVFAAGNRRLIDVPTLVLAPGGPTMVMGPNGAGKSLLLRLLHGLIAPGAGRVLAAGRPAGPAARRRQAMVFQRPVVLRRSVAANVAFALKTRGTPRAARRARVRALLGQARLADKARQSARTLSAGEAQRLALVRALAVEPALLFLDEPTASLDPAAAAAIEHIVAAAADAGTKIVMVTHDTGQARRLGAEVVFLHHGRVAEHTPAPAFFTAPRTAAARDFLAGALLV